MLIKVGFLGKPHGLNGEINLMVFPETGWHPAQGSEVVLKRNKCRNVPINISGVRGFKDKFLVRFSEIEDRNKAATIVNCAVFADIDALPEHTYKTKDIIGSLVKTVDHACLGTVVEVLSTKAHDLLRVEGETGEILIPAIRVFIRKFDEKKKEIVVDLPEGFES